MRFRLGTMGGGGTQQLGDGFGRGMQALFMAPLIRAQAQEEADYAGARRRLVESQIAENMAQAAIRQQEEQQLAQRGGVLDLMGATRAGMSVPEFRAGLQERQQGAPIVGPSVLHNREQPFNDAITTLYGPAAATPADKVNWDQMASARGKYKQQDVLDQVLAGAIDPGRAGSAVAASKGDKQFENIGTTGAGFNVHTGAGTVLDAALRTLYGNEVGSRIRENDAQAGQAGASANLSNARRERVVGGYDKPVTILDEDSGNAQITRIPTGQAPVTVGVSPKKATGVDATNAKERNRVVRDVEKELVGATDEEIEAEVDRRMARRGAKAPAPPKPAGQSIDMKRAAQIKADVKAGRMTREQGIAELRKLGFQ
jgi:hypothetical protein